MKTAHKKNSYRLLSFRLISGFTSLILLLFIADFIYSRLPAPKVDYGITFSVVQAKNLNLPIDKTYSEIINDLQVRRVRLPLYWDTIEKNPGQYDFSLYDRLLDLTKNSDVKYILVLGYKVPRWPECFSPSWTENLPNQKMRERILRLIEASVNHFKDRPAVAGWQVENEPLLDFGVCRQFDADFLKQEVNLVHQEDLRPVIITDAGERGWWVTPMQNGDIFGTTLYRTVWDKTFGDMTYPMPSIAYPLRYFLIQSLLARENKEVIISELQAEGWPAPNGDVLTTPADKQAQKFSLAKFKEVVNYAATTRISKQYLWGVEWWYFMKENGHPEYWEYAKKLFN